MAIGGYAIGADEGWIYVRAEYPIAVKRLEKAIEQAHEYGLLGENIFGTGFNFDIHIRLGAGAFVCGEETALMSSIEGKRGEPRPKPPFPAVKGLFESPTNINNVETLGTRTSAAAARTARSSRLYRPAVPPAAASPRACWISPWTMTP